IDSARSFHVRPFVYPLASRGDGSEEYEEDRGQRCAVRFFVKGAPYEVLGGWKSNIHLLGVDSPAQFFLFGSDGFGRHQFSRMLYGGRISLAAGLLATMIALALGGVLGLFSGYYGKVADMLVMRLVELFLALPWLYLLLAIRAALPLRVKTTDAFLLLVGIV